MDVTWAFASSFAATAGARGLKRSWRVDLCLRIAAFPGADDHHEQLSHELYAHACSMMIEACQMSF